MPELFPEFATSPECFLQAKAFWRELARDQAEALGQQGEWASWAHEEEWRDDPELMDGALVFSLFSASQHKALRVQQSALSVYTKKKAYVSSFMDVFGDGVLERPIPNMFIGAIPTDENLPLIRRLIYEWFRRDINIGAMQSFLEREVYEQTG